jgi:hypothetical protein
VSNPSLTARPSPSRAIPTRSRSPGSRLRVAIALLGLGLAVKLGFDTFGHAGTAG